MINDLIIKTFALLKLHFKFSLIPLYNFRLCLSLRQSKRLNNNEILL